MKIVEFRGYEIKVPANWPVYSLSKNPSQCVRYDENAVYLGTPGPNQHCPPGLVGTADTVSMGGPAIPGIRVVSSQPVQVVSGKTGRRASTGDLRSAAEATDLPAAPGTIMKNPGQHEFAIAMPSSAPSITATYGTDPSLILQVFSSLHLVTERTRPGGPLEAPGDQGSQEPWVTTRPTPDWGWQPNPGAETTRPHATPTAVYTPPWSDPSPRPTHWPSPSPTRTTRAPIWITPSPTATTPSPTATTPSPVETTPSSAPLTPAPTPTTPTPTGFSTAAPTVSAPPAQSAGNGVPVAGFDTCTAPSVSTMKAWRAKFSVANIYIGGQEMACDYGNLSASWVKAVEAMGWSLMPTFVGLQAPCNSYSAEVNPSQAAAQGRAAATLAISDAKQFGLGTGTPIYFDMEGYDHMNTGCVTAVLTFLDSWTRQLNLDGYISGVYSSAGSGAIDLQGNTMIAGHSLAEPQDMWFALWDNAVNLTGSPYLTGAVWPDTQRSKQYQGAHVVKVGGYSLDIDSDLVDSAVARG